MILMLSCLRMKDLLDTLGRAAAPLKAPLFHSEGATFSVTTLLVLLAALLALFWLSGMLRRWILAGRIGMGSADEGVRYAVGSIVRYVVIVLGLLAILEGLGVRLDAITVVAGALGVGIGFGLQHVTSNFVSGLVLLVERPIKVGDRIEVNGVNGDVVKIAPRATTIVTNDNIAMIVPNSSFITSTVVNWSYSDRNVRISVPVGVSYRSDLEVTKAVLLEVAREHPGVLADPAPDVVCDGFGDSAINLILRVWTATFTTRPLMLRSDLNFAITRAFREKSIEIPYPQRELHMKSGSLSAGT